MQDFFFRKKSGTEGFEPPSDGTKTRCLTAWPRPTNDGYDDYPTLRVSCQPAFLTTSTTCSARREKQRIEIGVAWNYWYFIKLTEKEYLSRNPVRYHFGPVRF